MRAKWVVVGSSIQMLRIPTLLGLASDAQKPLHGLVYIRDSPPRHNPDD